MAMLLSVWCLGDDAFVLFSPVAQRGDGGYFMTKEEILDCVYDSPSKEKLARALTAVQHGSVYTVELDEASFDPCPRLAGAAVRG